MDQISDLSDLSDRLARASDLPSALAAASDAFEYVRAQIRRREDPASGLFAALVMSEMAAINGRDALAGAPSLPPSALRPAAPAPQVSGTGPQVAGIISLTGRLWTRLAQAGRDAAEPGDQEACADAALRARYIHGLLVRVSRE